MAKKAKEYVADEAKVNDHFDVLEGTFYDYRDVACRADPTSVRTIASKQKLGFKEGFFYESEEGKWTCITYDKIFKFVPAILQFLYSPKGHAFNYNEASFSVEFIFDEHDTSKRVIIHSPRVFSTLFKQFGSAGFCVGFRVGAQLVSKNWSFLEYDDEDKALLKEIASVWYDQFFEDDDEIVNNKLTRADEDDFKLLTPIAIDKLKRAYEDNNSWTFNEEFLISIEYFCDPVPDTKLFKGVRDYLVNNISYSPMYYRVRRFVDACYPAFRKTVTKITKTISSLQSFSAMTSAMTNIAKYGTSVEVCYFTYLLVYEDELPFESDIADIKTYWTMTGDVSDSDKAVDLNNWSMLRNIIHHFAEKEINAKNSFEGDPYTYNTYDSDACMRKWSEIISYKYTGLIYRIMFVLALQHDREDVAIAMHKIMLHSRQFDLLEELFDDDDDIDEFDDAVDESDDELPVIEWYSCEYSPNPFKIHVKFWEDGIIPSLRRGRRETVHYFIEEYIIDKVKGNKFDDSPVKISFEEVLNKSQSEISPGLKRLWEGVQSDEKLIPVVKEVLQTVTLFYFYFRTNNYEEYKNDPRLMTRVNQIVQDITE